MKRKAFLQNSEKHFFLFFFLILFFTTSLNSLFVGNENQIINDKWLGDEKIFNELSLLDKDDFFSFFTPSETFYFIENKENLSKDEITSFKERIKLKDIIFFPLSDGSKSEKSTHWSLVIYNKKTNKFFLYDSLGNYNEKKSLELISLFDKLINESDEGFFGHSIGKEYFFCEILKINSPLQKNSIDCGFFVLSTIDFFLEKAKNDDQKKHLFEDKFWEINENDEKTIINSVFEKRKEERSFTSL
jgi:hypothetical protein